MLVVVTDMILLKSNQSMLNENIIKMLLKILLILLIVLKNQKEPLTTTQISLTIRGVISIQKFKKFLPEPFIFMEDKVLL